MSKTQTIIFIAIFYLNWFGCLIAAKYGADYITLFMSAIASYGQWLFCLKTNKSHSYLKWILAFAIVGMLIDTTLLNLNIINYKTNTWLPFAPPWILALWLNFGLVCCALQTQLRKFIRYMPLCAGIGSPLAYIGGMQFGVANFNSLPIGATVLGLIWAIFFPLLIWRLTYNEK